MSHSVLYITLGFALLCLFIVSGRLVEGAWAPPSLVFMVAFFSHAFLYVYVILIDEKVYQVLAFKRRRLSFRPARPRAFG